jgi:hypothetical protein
MSRSTLEVVKCDRCGTTDRFNESDRERLAWAVAHAVRRSDVTIAGGSVEDPLDLCPKCADELEAWFTAA